MKARRWEGRQTKSGRDNSTRRAVKHCEEKKSQRTREAVNEGVMKPCRWGQVIYNE